MKMGEIIRELSVKTRILAFQVTGGLSVLYFHLMNDKSSSSLLVNLPKHT